MPLKISIASGKGGTGKTLVATSIAASLAQGGKATIADCDVEEPNSYLFFPDRKLVEKKGCHVTVPVIDEEKCTHCGTCSRICPVKNIVMVGEKPEWQHHCELCMACLNLCPAQAIQWTEKTKNRGRYRHPGLKIADMKAQRGETLEE